MIIAFEGIDKSGKTTLLEDMKYMFDVSGGKYVTYKATIKPTREVDKDSSYYQYKAINDFADQNPKLMILLDRSAMSEMVYSGVKRDYDVIHETRYRDLLKRPDTLWVYVETDDETLKQRFEANKEEYAKTEDIASLRQRYEDCLTKLVGPLVRIKTPGDRLVNSQDVGAALAKILMDQRNPRPSGIIT